MKPSLVAKKKAIAAANRQGRGNKSKDTIVVAIEKTKSDRRSGRKRYKEGLCYEN
jgi:hypothetical protein